MKDLVEYLVKKLVSDPDAVNVTAIEDEQGALYEVRVAPDDMGKVIGREGRVANAIRTVVKSVAMKQGKRAQVEIVEPDRGAAPREEAAEREPDATDAQTAG